VEVDGVLFGEIEPAAIEMHIAVRVNGQLVDLKRRPVYEIGSE
jgi:hypothetical protein